jgi:signal transduction histidine kinase
LPLSDRSAAALLSAFIGEDSSARASALEAVLSEDPPLTVWCAVHPRRPKALPRDLRELAEWLAAQGLTVLQWSPEDAVVTSKLQSPRDWTSRCVERTARAFAWAERAEQLLNGAELCGRARLLAFLGGALEWLLASSTPRIDDLIERLAPVWLAEFAAMLRHPPAEDAAMVAVAQSVAPSETVAAQTALHESPASAIMHAERWAAPWPGSGALPRVMSQMARLATFEQDFETTLRREKLASLQKLAYGASHEINNPLANIATRAQTLLQEETDPERRRALATINDQAFRAFEMIANMMLFAKPPQPNLAEMDLRQVIDRVILEMTPNAELQGTRLLSPPGNEPVSIRADATQMAVLLRALLRNALEALEGGGEIEIGLRQDEGEQVQIRVHDTGPGLGEEARRHLFDPFYSGREAGRGLGFGLSWCWTIVELHQGQIAFESAPGEGTTFIITLPTAGP